MEINEELEILKKALVTHQTIFSDIHTRLQTIEKRLNIESGVPNSNEHYFYSKDENGAWLVKCAKTGGSFSTSVWRNEIVQKIKVSLLWQDSNTEVKMIKIFGLITNKQNRD